MELMDDAKAAAIAEEVCGETIEFIKSILRIADEHKLNRDRFLQKAATCLEELSQAGTFETFPLQEIEETGGKKRK